MAEPQQRGAQFVEFTDKDGLRFWLFPKAVHHIAHDNRIREPVVFIEHVFRNAIAIIESRSKPGTRLYYAKSGRLYSTVIANAGEFRGTQYLTSLGKMETGRVFADGKRGAD